MFPVWTTIPFVVLVLAIAVLPIVLPNAWENRRVQILVVAACAAPVVTYLLAHGHAHELRGVAGSYVSFATTLGALYVVAGGVHIAGDLVATPRVNVGFVVVGSVLAS